jgi:hypothetical protein
MPTAPPPLGAFGRSWQIQIATQDGGTFTISSRVADGETPLRVTFDIDTYALLAYWTAEITIYNLGNTTAKAILGDSGMPNTATLWKFNQPIIAGDTVSVSAGYQFAQAGPFNPASNNLFVGRVFQPIWTRENVVDWKLTLRCVNQLIADAFNDVNLTIPEGRTAQQAINAVCGAANITVDQTQDTADKLAQVSDPRAQTFFGKPTEVLSGLLTPNGVSAWLSQDAVDAPPNLHIRMFDPNNPPPTPDYAYGPPNIPGQYAPAGTTTGNVKQTLIGTPEQTQDGVQFKVLMDSGIHVGDMVQLAPGALIVPFRFQYNSTYPAVTSQSGQYVVQGVRHYGDSRGRAEDWYTEVTGVTMDFFQSFLQATTPSAPINITA